VQTANALSAAAVADAKKHVFLFFSRLWRKSLSESLQ
jgi:hypothetical protein